MTRKKKRTEEEIALDAQDERILDRVWAALTPSRKKVKKSRALPAGTIRTHGGIKKKKTADGKWVVVRQGKKAQAKKSSLDDFKHLLFTDTSQYTIEPPGRGVTKAQAESAAVMAGALPGSTVRMHYRKNPGSTLSVEWEGPGNSWGSREIEATKVYNSELHVDPNHAGGGTRVFATQVLEAQKAGKKEITCFAAKGGEYVGYYVWARLGYEPQRPEMFTDSIDGVLYDAKSRATQRWRDEDEKKEQWAIIEDFTDLMDDAGLDVMSEGGDLNADPADGNKILRALMTTEKGRKWWKDNGFSFTAKFSLAKNSNSMNVLTAYVAEKSKSWKGFDSGAKPKRRKGVDASGNTVAAASGKWKPGREGATTMLVQDPENPAQKAELNYEEDTDFEGVWNGWVVTIVDGDREVFTEFDADSEDEVKKKLLDYTRETLRIDVGVKKSQGGWIIPRRHVFSGPGPLDLIIKGGEVPSGPGWQPVPGGKHGGYRRKQGNRWVYWYQSSGHAARAAEHHKKTGEKMRKKLGKVLKKRGAKQEHIEKFLDKYDHHSSVGDAAHTQSQSADQSTGDGLSQALQDHHGLNENDTKEVMTQLEQLIKIKQKMKGGGQDGGKKQESGQDQAENAPEGADQDPAEPKKEEAEPHPELKAGAEQRKKRQDAGLFDVMSEIRAKIEAEAAKDRQSRAKQTEINKKADKNAKGPGSAPRNAPKKQKKQKRGGKAAQTAGRQLAGKSKEDREDALASIAKVNPKFADQVRAEIEDTHADPDKATAAKVGEAARKKLQDMSPDDKKARIKELKAKIQHLGHSSGSINAQIGAMERDKAQRELMLLTQYAKVDKKQGKKPTSRWKVKKTSIADDKKKLKARPSVARALFGGKTAPESMSDKQQEQMSHVEQERAKHKLSNKEVVSLLSGLRKQGKTSKEDVAAAFADHVEKYSINRKVDPQRDKKAR